MDSSRETDPIVYSLASLPDRPVPRPAVVFCDTTVAAAANALPAGSKVRWSNAAGTQCFLIGVQANATLDTFLVPPGLYDVSVYLAGPGSARYTLLLDGQPFYESGRSNVGLRGKLGLETVVNIGRSTQLSVVMDDAADAALSGAVAQSVLQIKRCV